MKNIVLILLLTLLFGNPSKAQNYEYVQQGEFGITAGVAHYFGDLNTRASVNRPKPALGIFYRKQFGNYIGARLAARYAQLGYSDTYSKSEVQKLRNLSFNTNIWEIALQGDFNFFKFVPGDYRHAFTPYVTIGVGAFSYDPYAYLNNEKVFLRPLGTEGQNIGYKGRKQYGTTALCIPFGVGIKYNINEKFNFSFEVSHRFTGTDYLDDVSTTYVGLDKFTSDATASIMQDRSFEIDPNNILGFEGRQRGFAKQKDQYLIAEIGISFNLSTYKCPTAR